MPTGDHDGGDGGMTKTCWHSVYEDTQLHCFELAYKSAFCGKSYDVKKGAGEKCISTPDFNACATCIKAELVWDLAR